MRKQRGFGDLIQMLLIGAAIAAASGAIYMAWTGFKEYIAKPYVEAQIAKDQVEIDTAESALAAAVKRAEGAEADAKTATDAAALQTQALQEAEALTVAAQAAARAAGIKYATEVAKHSERITRLQSIAGAASVAGQSCDATLADVDAILRDSQRIVNGVKK